MVLSTLYFLCIGILSNTPETGQLLYCAGSREYSFKRTIKYDSHMLDKPDFVGSYEIGEYVYFFLR